MVGEPSSSQLPSTQDWLGEQQRSSQPYPSPIYLSIYLPTYLSQSLPIYLSSIYLPLHPWGTLHGETWQSKLKQ